METPNINTGVGKSRIDDFRRRSRSIRASEGKIDSFKGVCPSCKHNKLFSGNNLSVKGQGIIKCCKCKHIISSL